MKNFISREQRSMLWRDEYNEEFLLLKCGEVFEYGQNIARCHFFSSKSAAWLRKNCRILNEYATDDPLAVLDVPMAEMGKIIERYGFKRRPHLKGKFLKKAEEKLAHEIKPYKPTELYG